MGRQEARAVAEHKPCFFNEKAADNKTINYTFAEPKYVGFHTSMGCGAGSIVICRYDHLC